MDRAEQRGQALARVEMLDALVMALERRAELLDVVAGSGSADEARARLQREWGLNEVQATCVLDVQVRRFAGRERDRIADERAELQARIAELDD